MSSSYVLCVAGTSSRLSLITGTSSRHLPIAAVKGYNYRVKESRGGWRGSIEATFSGLPGPRLLEMSSYGALGWLSRSRLRPKSTLFVDIGVGFIKGALVKGYETR